MSDNFTSDQNMKKCLLSSCYFGPVWYYSKLILFDETIIEQFDHYTKQTYRNRCDIYGANGKLSLSIPVIKNHGYKMLMKDVMIDYATDWQKMHYRALVSSYNSSAFFEYYFDELQSIYFRKTKFLLDLNNYLHSKICRFLDLPDILTLSQKFASASANEAEDYRDIIHPKRSFEIDNHFRPSEYYQVFRDKHGFIPNLSVIDLLFNEGPQALSVLKQSTN